MSDPKSYIISPDTCILVTGSGGFIGGRVVRSLLACGFTNLRCLVRSSAQANGVAGHFEQSDRRIQSNCVVGDLLSQKDCRHAAEGVSVVLHLAAGMDKSFAGAFMNSALATRNLMDAFLEVGRPKRFVNVSSFAVYSNFRLERGALLDEAAPLEDSPQDRFDAYCFGKLKQEELVKEYGKTRGLPYVILRPGTVFGPGKKSLTGRIGIDTFGFFIHLGGSNVLPLTYVDNCAEAIVLAGLKPGIDGEVFNIVDDELLTSREFLRAYKKKVKRFFSVPMPYFMAYWMCCLWEAYSRRSQGQVPPAFNRRRCAAEWKGNRYSNQKLRERLDWQPRVGMKAAMESFLSQFNG